MISILRFFRKRFYLVEATDIEGSSFTTLGIASSFRKAIKLLNDHSGIISEIRLNRNYWDEDGGIGVCNHWHFNDREILDD